MPLPIPIILAAAAAAARAGATAATRGAARGAARGGSATGRAAAGARGSSTARSSASKARGAAAKKTAAKKAINKKGAEGPKPSTFRSTTKGVSKVTGGPLRNGKPVKLGPRKKTLTPAQKRAQTIAMKKARATYAAEGPKKSVAAKPTTAAKKSKFTTKRKVGAGLGLAAGGSIIYGANKKGTEGPKRSTLPKGSSVGNLVWNGNTWIAKKK